MSSRGCGRRPWWRSSSAICARSKGASSRQCGVTRTRCGCSAPMSAIPITGGIGCANSDSARIPHRCFSIGTPRSTCRTTSSPRPSARSPSESCRISSTTPTTRSSLIAASARKGWLPAYRDATMFKVAYSYGLRFNELRHLQTVDFSRNAHAREFGRYGVVQVRYGKAKKGSPPKRRGVLTVFDVDAGGDRRLACPRPAVL